MAEKDPISVTAIENSLQEISLGAHFIEVERRKAEAQIGWFVSSPGILLGDPYTNPNAIKPVDRRFITTNPLKGSVRKLSRRTLLTVQSYVVPRDSSPEAIDTYFDNHGRTPELSRFLGFISLNEPGMPIVRPTKTEARGYFDIPSGLAYDAPAIASVGVSHYLNNPLGIHTVYESAPEVNEIIGLTNDRYDAYIRHALESTHKLLQKSMQPKNRKV